MNGFDARGGNVVCSRIALGSQTVSVKGNDFLHTCVFGIEMVHAAVLIVVSELLIFTYCRL